MAASRSEPGELRWPDGVHLDERSAVIVAQAMERTFDGAGGEVTANEAWLLCLRRERLTLRRYLG
jgi:hypothetical protein